MAAPLTPEQYEAIQAQYGKMPMDLAQRRANALELLGKPIPSTGQIQKPKPSVVIAPANPQYAPTKTVAPIAPVKSPTASESKDAVDFASILKGQPYQVQPETGFSEALREAQGGPPDKSVGAAAWAKKDLYKTLASIPISEESKEKMKERAKVLEEAPRTYDGDRRVTTPSTQTIESVFGGGITGQLLGALAPQEIKSSQDVKEDDAKKRQARELTVEFKKNNPQIFAGLSPKDTNDRMIQVYNGYLYGEDGDPGIAKTITDRLFTQKMPSGAIIESPIVTAGKILNIGEATVVAGARTGLQGVTGKPITPVDNLAGELKSGMGIMGAGAELGKTAGGAFAENRGMAPDAKAYYEDLGENIGGFSGFAASLLVPVDLGITSLIPAAAKGSTGSVKVAKAFGETGLDLKKAGVYGALSGGWEGIRDTWWISPRTGGNAAISDQVRKSSQKFLESEKLSQVTEKTLELASDPIVQAAIRADLQTGKNAKNVSQYSPESLNKTLENQYRPTSEFPTFDSFKEAAESYGIDFTNTAGLREARKNTPPKNVLSKEDLAAEGRTSTGARTTNHFDDLAMGGRSDLYYMAALDNLTDEAKLALSEGKAINKGDLLPAIDTYMNNIRKTKSPAEVIAIGEGLRAHLKSKGIDVGDRVFGGKSKNLSIGGMILPSDPTAKAAVNKALRIDTTKKMINNFAKDTGLVGTQQKLGGITLSREDAKDVINTLRKNPANNPALDIINRLRDGFVKGGAVPEVISAEELGILTKYFQDNFSTGINKVKVSSTSPLPTYSKYETLAALENIAAQSGKVSTADFNNLVRGSISIEASGKLTAKTESDIYGISSSLKAEDKNIEYQYFAREVFKPKDFAQNAAGAIVLDNARRMTSPPNKSPVATDLISGINQKMAALPDRFKLAMRQAEANLSDLPVLQRKPAAFAKTIVDEYAVSGVIATGADLKITASQAEEMFRSNFAAMFGGYEKQLDVISTTGKLTEATPSGAITVQEMRSLVSVMMELPGIKVEVVAFKRALAEGDNVRAINLLQKVHAKYFGFSIEQIVTKSAPGVSIGKALEDAEKTSTGVENIGRSTKSAFEAASTQSMVVAPGNFKELLVGIYFSKAQANIVEQSMAGASAKYPTLFPTKVVIEDMANKDYEVVKAGLANALESSRPPSARNIPSELEIWLSKSSDEGFGLDRRGLLIAAVEDEIARRSIQTSKDSSYARRLVDEKIKQEIALLDETGPNYSSQVAEIKNRNEPYVKQIRDITDSLSQPPGSVYSNIYGGSLNIEMDAKAYAAGLAEMKNQLKLPFAPSVQGAAEKVGNIPSLSKEASGIRGPLVASVNLQSITDTMETITLASGSAQKLDEVIAKNGAKFSDDLAEAQAKIDDIVNAEMKDIQRAVDMKTGVMKDYNNGYRRFVLALGEHFNTVKGIPGKLPGLMKGGMLSGQFAPNMVYMLNNVISAPAIIMSQLGIREGVRSMGTFLDLDLHDIMMSVYNPHAGKLVDRVIVDAPDGTVYTTSMFRDYVKNGLIGQSQASAELTNSLVDDAVKWAGKTGLLSDQSAARKFFSRNLVNNTGVNIWSSTANMCDQYYRVGVLKRALAAGEQLPQASKLAREALFDYGNLTSGEKSMISKAIWFWSFRRNNWRSLLVSAFNDPRALKAAFNQRQGWGYGFRTISDTKRYMTKEEGTEYENHKDYKYVMDKYSESKAFMDLVEDPENKRRYGLYGPGIPQVQAVADLVDLMSVPVAYFAAQLPGTTEVSDLPRLVIAVGEKGFENVNPLVQGVVASVLGINIQDGSDLGGYLDPRLMYWIRNTPAGDLFDVWIATEPVPEKDEKPGLGSYNGHQWRIVKGDNASIRAWALLRTAMMTGGIQRMLNDYASTFSLAKEGLSPSPGYSPDLKLSTGRSDVDALRSLGIIGVGRAPTIEEVKRSNRWAAGHEISDLSTTYLPPKERKTQ